MPEGYISKPDAISVIHTRVGMGYNEDITIPQTRDTGLGEGSVPIALHPLQHLAANRRVLNLLKVQTSKLFV